MEEPIKLDEATKTEESTQPRQATRKKLNPNLLLVVIAIVVICFTLLFFARPKKEPEPQIDITSTLEKIVETSDLSTAVFDYQGIVEIPNKKNLKKIDYYILYDASVYAGIDFSQVKFIEDKTAKTITAVLPAVKIQDTVVDPDSLEFMFQNKKANDISILDSALTACETDIQQECTSESAILDIARMNAENAVRALTEPVMNNLCKDYTLVVESAAVPEEADRSAASEEGSVNHEA